MTWERLLTAILLGMLLALPTNGQSPRAKPLPVASSLAGTTTWEKLAQPVTIDVRVTPLTDVLQKLAEQVDVEVVIHPQAFTTSGVVGNHPVNLVVEGISGRSGLLLLLKPLGLQFSVLADGRVVVDSEATRHAKSVRTYEVADLVDDITGPVDDETAEKTLKGLKVLVTTTVGPESWEDVGGSGAISVNVQDRSLVVRQSPGLHAETTLLLLRLRELRHARVPSPDAMALSWQFQQQIRDSLESTRISVSSQDDTLSVVISDVARQAGVNMVLDSRGLSEEGITPETLVSLSVHDKLVVEVLGRLLEPLNLDYVLEDEVVKITSRMRALGEPSMVVYAVGDLVDSPADADQPVPREQLDELARELQQQIMPNTWEPIRVVGSIRCGLQSCERTSKRVGGFASILPHESTGSLVVFQAKSVHEQIQEWLQAKREGIDR